MSVLTHDTVMAKGYKDQIREPLFDTYVFANDEKLNGIRTFFNDIKAKSPSLTNMRIDGQLERGVEFLIQGISAEAHTVNPNNASVLADMMEASAVALKIGEKNYYEGSLRFICGRLDAFHATTESAKTFHLTQYGRTAVNGIVLVRNDSLKLNSQQSFKLTVATEGLADTKVVKDHLNLTITLQGIKRRPIQ